MIKPMHFIKKNKITTLLLSSFMLFGCITTSEEPEQAKINTHRATLADLATQNKTNSYSPLTLTKQERAEKLAQIYRSILTLEPDTNVRANVEYRLAQIDSQNYDNYADLSLTQDNLAQNSKKLQLLINEYQSLLARYPTRPDNEFIRYQLAKALDLQGKTSESLAQINQLLAQYPNSEYSAELNFRRGDIYYNLQKYQAALNAYQQAIKNENNDKYLLNSIYMSGWSLFKLNRLEAANEAFMQVFETLIATSKHIPNQEHFTFEQLSSRYKGLAQDTQRVLSISLSQLEQAKSLVKLVKQENLAHVNLYQHLLFKHLADFLLKKELPQDAELAYQAYIDLEPNNIWAARFSLNLLELYKKHGRAKLIRPLQEKFVSRYQVHSAFWQQASNVQQSELLPYLLAFSYSHSHRLYANAQQLPMGTARINQFKQTAKALHTYLAHAQLPQAKPIIQQLQAKLNKTQAIEHDNLTNEYLYADANFEAQQYSIALHSYISIAEKTLAETNKNADLLASWQTIQQKAAYASTVTIRKLIAQYQASKTAKNLTADSSYSELISQRNTLDKQYITRYPNDKRSLAIATQATEYSFADNNYEDVAYFSNFVLSQHQVSQLTSNKRRLHSLTKIALKQINIVSQLQANSLYKQAKYQAAEKAYKLAIQFVDKQQKTWSELRNLIASCIYFQGQAIKATSPMLAINHFLRLGEIIPESQYRTHAEFDAANLLLEQKQWQQAVDVLLTFQKRYPKHEYSATIPAKLAESYANLAQWDLAAEQMLVIVATSESKDLQREAQYTAAEYYLKAGNREKARLAYRTYAHTYPEPFDVAQEVRFKMAEFYSNKSEANKRYYWYRKILTFHQKHFENTNNTNMTARELFLASTAAFSLGQAHQQSFKRIKLKAPLKNSLKRKQKEMKRAIAYYQQVLDLQMAKFVPHATYNLAKLYQQLAADVLASQRPSNLDELALEEYQIVLEELATPFEEKAIEIYLTNSQRAWQDVYDPWIAKSFEALAKLSPALYDRKERIPDVIDAIY